MNQKILCIFFIPILFLSACAPGSRKVVEPVGPARTGTGLPIEEELVDRKITLLQDMVTREDLSQTDRDTALQLLDSYRLLKKSAAGRTDEEGLRELVLSLSKSLSRVDEPFFSREDSLMLSGRETAARLLKERERITALYREGDYKGVIRDCLRLRSEFGSDAVSLELGLLFALSLGEEGKLQEAIQLGEGIARQLKETPDLAVLRTHIARWQLKLGNRNGALTTYEQLTGDLEEAAALVKALKADLDAPVAPDAGPEKIGVEKSDVPDSGRAVEGKTTAQIIEESRLLIRKNRYDEARQLLVRHGKNVEEESALEQLESALQEVEEARSKFETEKSIRNAYVQKTLAAATALIESDQFEEAIQKLENISRVDGENSEATLLKDRAVEGIINRGRNNAAQLFLSARKTGDIAEKEALLTSALRILADLVEKYPSSDLKEKVLSNMSRVEYELQKLKGSQ